MNQGLYAHMNNKRKMKKKKDALSRELKIPCTSRQVAIKMEKNYKCHFKSIGEILQVQGLYHWVSI
jgi:hypothetical protein